MARTSKHSYKERTGVDRLYKRVGIKKVSFYYQYPSGASETLATAPLGDRLAINEAERSAKRKALDIQQGKVLAGSAAEGIDRFEQECDKTHYRDQSKDGIAVRRGAYANLRRFFGNMLPAAIKTLHGYQYADARAKSGAPVKGWKELAQFSTICHKWVEWGIIETNPMVNMRKPRFESDVRVISRSQVVQFYLWSQRQEKPQVKVLGCAALFTYLTGYRAAEIRPFHRSGLTAEGIRVVNAKRKMGDAEVVKVREWSAKLRTVVKRADQALGRERMYLFANRHGKAYSRSGWGAVWQDAMAAYLRDKPETVANKPGYFAISDIRPAAITAKFTKRAEDAYDFAAHANPATTHTHYDRRRVKKASATE